MTLAQFILNTNYALKGTDDDPPTVGDDDYVYWVTVLNRKKNELYDDSERNWQSAWKEGDSVGTIAEDSALSFELDDSFINPAEKAFIITSDGQYHYFDVIKPQERDRRYQQVYIAGINPQVLYLTAPVLEGDRLIGGELFLPGFYRPADVSATRTAAIIPLPDPNWGVMAVAAQIAFNDITYEDKFNDLNGQANNLYRQMARKNSRGVYGNPRISKTSVKRIAGFR